MQSLFEFIGSLKSNTLSILLAGMIIGWIFRKTFHELNQKFELIVNKLNQIQKSNKKKHETMSEKLNKIKNCLYK